MLRCACPPRAARGLRSAAALALALAASCAACGRQVRRAAAAHRRHRAQRAQGPAEPAARRLGAGARPRTPGGSGLLLMRQWLATQYPMRHGCATMAGRAVPHATTHRTFPARTGRLFVCLVGCLFVCLFARGAPAPSAAQCQQSGFAANGRHLRVACDGLSRAMRRWRRLRIERLRPKSVSES
jgi:hypothetical protein